MQRVKISKKVLKRLKKLPRHIVVSLMSWVGDVEEMGLKEARVRPGYHDEPLKGQRKHQRSIRLSRAYRAIYEVVGDGCVEFVSVEEVSKHEY